MLPENGSFASLPSYTQRFVFIFFRHRKGQRKLFSGHGVPTEVMEMNMPLSHVDLGPCTEAPAPVKGALRRTQGLARQPHGGSEEDNGNAKPPSAKPSYFSAVGPVGYM